MCRHAAAPWNERRDAARLRVRSARLHRDRGDRRHRPDPLDRPRCLRGTRPARLGPRTRRRPGCRRVPHRPSRPPLRARRRRRCGGRRRRRTAPCDGTRRRCPRHRARSCRGEPRSLRSRRRGASRRARGDRRRGARRRRGRSRAGARLRRQHPRTGGRRWCVAGRRRVLGPDEPGLRRRRARPSSGETSFAALLSGERFGAGLVVDGVLLRGTHGGAGEMRVLDLVEGVGSSDGIGATARRLVLEAVAAGEVPADGPLPLDADAAAVFAAARAGDRVALAIVDRLGDRLARVCVLLASLLDIDRVVVAGAIARPAAAVIDRARALLGDWNFDPVPEIVASSLGADVVVIGAVAHAVDAVRGDPLSFPLRPVHA
ncbi:ROK family protein [Curtobacterium pusillum]|uniref:ROK family protein n=1 Tax=Curtobacterium pusillum TaxID=69373 RepID=UPI0031D8ACE5